MSHPNSHWREWKCYKCGKSFNIKKLDIESFNESLEEFSNSGQLMIMLKQLTPSDHPMKRAQLFGHVGCKRVYILDLAQGFSQEIVYCVSLNCACLIISIQ